MHFQKPVVVTRYGGTLAILGIILVLVEVCSPIIEIDIYSCTSATLSRLLQGKGLLMQI